MPKYKKAVGRLFHETNYAYRFTFITDHINRKKSYNAKYQNEKTKHKYSVTIYTLHIRYIQYNNEHYFFIPQAPCLLFPPFAVCRRPEDKFENKIARYNIQKNKK